MNNLVKNEKGYTLLEILLSISLLSIVTLVFFGFFIQAKSATVQSQSKMSAVQFSQEVLAKVKSSNYQSNLTAANWQTLFNNPNPSQGGIDSKGEFYIQVDNQKYYPVAIISRATSPLSNNFALIQIQIWVYQKGTKVQKFETYGFKGWSM